ncbi:Uncharacterised protein [Bordetella pertussis]|nr:Uncharacterised protein [Bordetella pertussis]CFU12512.1 Uncharacterised protein [Bordetella pertussis]
MSGSCCANGCAGRAKREGACPISTAMACSNWPRCQSRSMDWARVFSSWVRATATSDLPTTPAS